MIEWQASAFVFRGGQECRKPNTTTKADFLPLHFGEGIGNQTYINLTLAEPGDIIFSYASAQIQAVGIFATVQKI
jgi:hypothetical protein